MREVSHVHLGNLAVAELAVGVGGPLVPERSRAAAGVGTSRCPGGTPEAVRRRIDTDRLVAAVEALLHALR